MNKYKINFIYDGDHNVNDIFIKVLNRELEIYLEGIKNNKIDASSNCFSLKGEKN